MFRFLRNLDWFAVATGTFFLFVTAWIPLWRRWSVSSWEAFGGYSSLWSAAEGMFQGSVYIGIWEWLFVWHLENWVQALVVFFTGFMFGWGMRKLLGSSAILPPKG